jgi:hypothetical protein
MVLHNFYFVFAQAPALRVGFAQKRSATTGSNSALCQAVQCIGAQTFDESANQCVDPACSVYFLQQVDDVSKTCYRVCCLYLQLVLQSFD